MKERQKSAITSHMKLTYTNVMSPVNLLSSIPPNVISPLVVSSSVVGSKEIPTRFESMRPCAKALSVTVAGHAAVSGNKVAVEISHMSILVEPYVTYHTSNRWAQFYSVRGS